MIRTAFDGHFSICPLGTKNHKSWLAGVHVNFSLWIIFNLYHFDTQEKDLEAYIYQVLDRLD